MKKTPPLDLPRLVMRRAILVALVAVVLALLVGLQRTQEAIDEEVEAAMTLAAVMARLGTLSSVDDRSALESLRAMQAESPLRHLELNIRTAEGRLLFAPPPHQASGLMENSQKSKIQKHLTFSIIIRTYRLDIFLTPQVCHEHIV